MYNFILTVAYSLILPLIYSVIYYRKLREKISCHNSLYLQGNILSDYVKKNYCRAEHISLVP